MEVYGGSAEGTSDDGRSTAMTTSDEVGRRRLPIDITGRGRDGRASSIGHFPLSTEVGETSFWALRAVLVTLGLLELGVGEFG